MKLIYRIVIFISFVSMTSPVMPQDLQGREIVITTPSSYASRLAKAIEDAGGQAISLPAIETVIPDTLSKVDTLVKHTENFDWIVLPSRNAIHGFFKKASLQGVRKNRLNKQLYCTIGKDSELLSDTYNIEPAIIPSAPSPAGIAHALSKKGEKGDKILVIAPEVRIIPEPDVIPEFINELQRLDFKVTRLNGYVTQPTPEENHQKILQRMADGRFDMLAFTSTGEIEALKHLVDLSRLPKDLPIACFGPYTANNAKTLKLEVDLTGKDYSSFEGFADAMVEYFTKRGRN